MEDELVDLLKNKGAGYFPSAMAENLLKRNQQEFGGVDPRIIGLLTPYRHISKTSIKYFKLPRDIRNLIRGPDRPYSDWVKDQSQLFFFHYSIDKNHLKKQIRKSFEPPNLNSPTNQRILGLENEKASFIFTTLLCESFFFGKQELMQTVVDYLKRDYANTYTLAAGLFGEKIARLALEKCQSVRVYDTINSPREVIRISYPK